MFVAGPRKSMVQKTSTAAAGCWATSQETTQSERPGQHSAPRVRMFRPMGQPNTDRTTPHLEAWPVHLCVGPASNWCVECRLVNWHRWVPERIVLGRDRPSAAKKPEKTRESPNRVGFSKPLASNGPMAGARAFACFAYRLRIFSRLLAFFGLRNSTTFFLG